MRNMPLIPICGLLLIAAACGSDSSDVSDPEIRSQEDVQRLFQAVMPDLVAAFTELANQQFPVAALLPSIGDKANGSSDVPCPGGGNLGVNLETGEATLTDCSAGGVTISAALFLFVSSTGPSAYQANFSGILTVSGSFIGTVEVLSAFIEWTDPASDANTFWEVTVSVGGQIFIATSAGGFDCPEVNGGGNVPGNGMCDDDSDCLSDSCRDPATNPSEGCTCRHVDGGGGGGGDCSACLGTNAAAPNEPSDRATDCGTQAVDFMCTCATERGNTVVFALSPAGCF
jgi:hypothetical protein